ncbi:MAG: Trk system potassium transporter TrkA [Acidimicrobiales bacterium]|nr:Trk system potassium transporter TrkA [Hyphomonadaceae bacterium]RZV42768.1 MAG: Trk system potassium transporter TrkA [Acidimicrobiales bacterium]
MNIIICGAGRVGYGIAEQLSAERNSVTIVDISADLIQTVTTELDVRGIVGNGSFPSVLQDAGAENADMIIAVTYSDEVNMIACQIAHSLFGTPMKIARVRAQDYLEDRWRDLYSRKNMPIDIIISPEIEIGKAVLRRLNTPGAFDVVPFANGTVQLVGVHIKDECPIVNIPVQQIDQLFPDLKATIVGVSREKQFFVPKHDDQLEIGDDAYFVVESINAHRLFDIVGSIEEKARQIVIIGGGNIGSFVARELEKVTSVRVRVIEKDKARAERTADQLRQTVVLNGDALSVAVQEEAGVGDAQTVLCLTNDDKTNILASIMAKSIGNAQVFSLINDTSFLDMKSSLDIDMIIDPRMTTVSSILTHVRKGRILDVFAIENGLAEVMEGEVLETSPMSGKSLADSAIPDGVAIGAIIRDNVVLKPKPELIIRNRDRIVLSAEKSDLKFVEQLFRVSLDYF